MKHQLAALALTLPLALAGCSGQDFRDEAQKEEAYGAYVCSGTIQASESRKSTYASEAATYVLADPEASEADKKIALEVKRAAMGHEDGYSGPPLTTSPDGESCYGWVWEKYFESRRQGDEYESFTWKDAEDAGIIEYNK